MRIVLSILFILAIIFSFGPSISYAQNFDVDLIVEGCNNNLICEPIIGETLLSCPLDCTPAPVSTTTDVDDRRMTGSNRSPQLISIDVHGYVDNAVVSWTTSELTLDTISWGRTDDYDLGTISEVSYSNSHEAKISNLIPNTRYYILITGRDVLGRSFAYRGSFYTEFAPDRTPPMNVSNFKGVYNKNGILLSWTNPPDIDFSSVKLIRNDWRYPRNLFDGKTLLEGGRQAFIDDEVKDGKKYYYAIFARDTIGNYSSGALFGVMWKDGSIHPLDSEYGVPVGSDSGVIYKDWGEKKSLIDLNIYQFDKLLKIDNSLVSVHPDSGIKLTLPNNIFNIGEREIVTISVQNMPNEGSVSMFLFSENQEEGIYETMLPFLEPNKRYPFRVKASSPFEKFYYEGVFEVSPSAKNEPVIGLSWLDAFITRYGSYLIIGFVIMLLVVLIFIGRRVYVLFSR